MEDDEHKPEATGLEEMLSAASSTVGVAEEDCMTISTWTASVQLVSPESRTYVGRVQDESNETLYTRNRNGEWRRHLDDSPADEHQNSTLKFLLMLAMMRTTDDRRTELTGRWGEQGPELID